MTFSFYAVICKNKQVYLWNDRLECSPLYIKANSTWSLYIRPVFSWSLYTVLEHFLFLILAFCKHWQFATLTCIYHWQFAILSFYIIDSLQHWHNAGSPFLRLLQKTDISNIWNQKIFKHNKYCWKKWWKNSKLDQMLVMNWIGFQDWYNHTTLPWHICTWYTSYFLKIFFFVKIESWNFVSFHETRN